MGGRNDVFQVGWISDLDWGPDRDLSKEVAQCFGREPRNDGLGLQPATFPLHTPACEEGDEGERYWV